MSSRYFEEIEKNSILGTACNESSRMADIAAVLRNIDYFSDEGRNIAFSVLKEQIPQYKNIIKCNLEYIRSEYASINDYVDELKDELVMIEKLEIEVRHMLETCRKSND